jgi:hypothetical protein
MKEVEVTDSMDNPNNLLEPFKVYVRIRPSLSKEILKLKRNNSSSLLTGNNANNKTNHESIFRVENRSLYVYDNKYNRKERKYVFNNIFTEKNNNDNVFDVSIKPMINNVINGYNSTCLAYGVTGTGKTHTIFGDLVFKNGEDGIAIKACDYLFKKLSNKYFEDDFIIKVSYIEIYNENVIDLLNSESTSLMIIEDPNKGVYCQNIKEYVINNCLELKKIICQGNKRRTMAPTNQNKFSSRSHAILQISLERKSFNDEANNFDIYFSKFLMVDLAGSERGGLEKGKRREEGANINKSLFTLGSCINILSDKNKSGKFIPYRDSKLTRLLKDSLGGNILTVMLVCISPSRESYDESISSLNYAARAKKIKKKIFQNKKEIDFVEGNNNINFKNNNSNQYEEIIGSLKNEIYQLKSIIKDQQNKLRDKSKSRSKNNDTLNLDDDTLIKDAQKNPNFNKKFFNEESSIISSIQLNNSQININTKNNKNQNNNINDINLSLVQTINEIDTNKYNIFFNEIKNKDYEINSLQEQIENIKKDKNNLELYLEKNHMLYNDNIENIINTNDNNNENDNNICNPEQKYIIIKNYYDKFLEVINDKLIENIEQNMILKCNIKEIKELNKNNIDTLENLNKQIENYKKNEKRDEHDCEFDDKTEQIKNIKNTIKENLMLKNEIFKTYNDNLNKKKMLKQILLSLLGDKRENSNKLINILKDKEKLVKMNKEFQKKIDKYLKMQKKKDNDINLVQRQVEILRAQLKEKEKKIIELKKFNNSRNNANSINKNRNTNNNFNNNTNYFYIKKNKYDINNFIKKGKRSASCIRNCSNQYKLKKNDSNKDDKIQKAYFYCYDASNDINTISNNCEPKLTLNKNIYKLYDNSCNKKRNNNHIKYKSKSEERIDNIYANSINDENNNLFKKMIFRNNKDTYEDNNMTKIIIYQNDNNINNKQNESDKKKNNRNFNELLMKYNQERNNNYQKTKNINKYEEYTRNNKKSMNLSQKRYQKFMNNRLNNNSHNNYNNQEEFLMLNISKKINKQIINKKLSLNEARYEKKIKNEKAEKQRDLSVEANHAYAEYFINSFKGMNLKINKNPNYFENTSPNFFQKNKIITENSQNMGNIINNEIEKKDKQNSTINMDGNPFETKENESTNIKTDQTKILKTEDIYQDLVNSMKNNPFKFKHK